MINTVMPTINNVFGQSASYTLSGVGTVYPVVAIVQKDVIVPSGLTGASEYRTQIEIASSSLAGIIPKRNDVITIGTDRWIVLSLESDDGYLSRFIVRPGNELTGRASVDTDALTVDSTADTADKSML